MKTSSKRLSLAGASQTADLGPRLTGFLRVLVKNVDPANESEELGHRGLRCLWFVKFPR